MRRFLVGFSFAALALVAAAIATPVSASPPGAGDTCDIMQNSQGIFAPMADACDIFEAPSFDAVCFTVAIPKSPEATADALPAPHLKQSYGAASDGIDFMGTVNLNRDDEPARFRICEHTQIE